MLAARHQRQEPVEHLAATAARTTSGKAGKDRRQAAEISLAAHRIHPAGADDAFDHGRGSSRSRSPPKWRALLRVSAACGKAAVAEPRLQCSIAAPQEPHT